MTDERDTIVTERDKHSELARTPGNMAIIYGAARVMKGYE